MLLKGFLETYKQLNKVNITPTLMGSVGLGFVSGIDWQPSDIDLHVSG